MPTDASFRFSTYLTLALACAAIAYAEYPLLPEVIAFAVLAVIGLGVLYLLESRVTFLSIPAANRLGMAIGIVYVMWASYRVKREVDTAEFVNMGWHMLFVAMCGPLVMLVIVAKVARGDKHAGDYWGLHGVALAGVGLAAAFAEEPACFVLVGLYLVAAVWSLTLLHLGRARGAIPPIPGGRQPATKTVAVSADPTGHRTDLTPAILWAGIVVAGAVPLYLLTPRSAAGKADFGKPRIEIGYAADQMVDLNRTGPLGVNDEPAFEVTATYPNGQPKTDLNPDQLWRGSTRRIYHQGEWQKPDWNPPLITPLASRVDVWTAPNLGPGQFALSFDVPGRLRSTFTADPAQWAPGQPPPLASFTDAGIQPWMTVPDGTFYWEPTAKQRANARRYIQVYRTADDPTASPPFRFIDRSFDATLGPIRNNPVPRVKQYADAVLKELERSGRLPEGWRHEGKGNPKPEHWDLVARLFAAHLKTTPELSYTTDLKRGKTGIDPIEDFLFHVKSGHCERYAGALVLMLRSQNIPAVYVLGFKGCEPIEDGKYVVKQEHAHAWVEALVPVPGQTGDDPFRFTYHWRTLDPTPGGGASASDTDDSWFGRTKTRIGAWFRDYVTNYTPEQRQKALAEFAAAVTRPQVLGGVAAAVCTLFALRYVRRRRAARAAEPPAPAPTTRWFNELVTLLAAHGIVAAPGDTPREFAQTAAAALRARPGGADVAGVPLAWVDAYYDDRFGGTPPTAARLIELEAGLAALRTALHA